MALLVSPAAPLAWPTGGFTGWKSFADALKARMQLLQLHVESDWLFALCTSCGWDLELSRSELGRFRYEAAAHICPAVPSIELVESSPVESQRLLF